MKRRVGLLGGTFDPPHLAHLVLAEGARHQLGLDEVLFLPAARPPHKPTAGLTPADLRLRMVRAAVRGLDGFRAVSLEIERGGVSYTVDTLEELHRRHPRTEWWLVVGADTLTDLPGWRSPRRVLALAGLAVAPRPGHPARWPRAVPRGRFAVLDLPQLDLSSSELRERAARGASIRFLVPEGVERLARRHRLYRERAERPGAAAPPHRARRRPSRPNRPQGRGA